MAKRLRGSPPDYRAMRRQIKAKLHEASIPQPTSRRNKYVISWYHHRLFGQTKTVDGRRRHMPGLLSGEYAITKLTPEKAAVVKRTLTYHNRPINAGLPRLGNQVITQPGKVRVTKKFIVIERKHVKQYIPRIDRRDFISARAETFERAAASQPPGTDIAVRIGRHVLPGTYADIEAARREYLRLVELYKDNEDIDIAIEFISFENQEEPDEDEEEM